MLMEALATGGMGLLGGGISAYSGYKSNERNIEMQRETNQQNERLLRESWGREDNAIQRRTTDLKAAGLSPVLAAGQGASSMSPIKMEAPQGNDWGSQAASQAISSALAASQMAQTQAQLKLTKAQERQVDTNTNITLLKTPSELNAINAAAAASRGSAFQSTQSGRVTAVDAKKAETTGLTPSASVIGKIGNDVMAAGGHVRQKMESFMDDVKKKGYIQAYRDSLGFQGGKK
ncbi:MAG: DNA pilot protein [Arizlama microvirus]|nr:MAG: DNA pilot protein [Arizlama microvirus]